MKEFSKHQYNIGAVARLTQIHAETIRVWERRYELVVPERTDTGRRVYSEGDIERLLLVKQLTELGHAVSGLADLSNDSLKELLTSSQATHNINPPSASSPCRVVFADGALKIRLARNLSMYTDIELVELGELNHSDAADVLVISLATVGKDSLSSCQLHAQRLSCRSTIVVYSFGQPSAIKQLNQAGITCLKNPVSANEIREACKAVGKKKNVPQSILNEKISSRRFSEEQLAKVATLKGSIACECPNHLAELIISLCAFEEYSRECENANPRDAIIHKQLHQATSHARTILEESLTRLIEIEGIEV